MSANNPTAVLTYTQQNAQLLTVYGLRSAPVPPATTGSYVNTASPVATLFDSTNTPVTGLTNLPLTYVAGTNGVYQGTIPASFNPPVGTGYTTVITESTLGLHLTYESVVAVRAS